MKSESSIKGSTSGKLLLLSGSFVVGFALVVAYSYYSSSALGVNGPANREANLQQGLLSDVQSASENISAAYAAAMELAGPQGMTESAALEQRLAAHRKEYTGRHDEWEAHLPTGDAKNALLGAYAKTATQFFDVIDQQLIPAAQSGRPAARLAAIAAGLTPLYEASRSTEAKIVAMANDQVQTLRSASATAGEQSLVILAVAAAVLLLLLIILTIRIGRAVSRPMRDSVNFALKIARGDLTERLSDRHRSDLGQLANAMNEMTERLRGMMIRVQQGAEHVAGSSELIAASAHRLAESSQIQASTLEETSSAVEELTASVGQVADSAQSQAAAMEEGANSMAQVRSSIEEVSKTLEQISSLAGESVENALQGAEAVSEVVAGINLIAESSEKIGGIVTVISDIADQTNLLALNASIEAARAGEHGRGFAVVADEVSKLADRSSSSTKEIEGLIHESVNKVAKGVQIAKGSQQAMEQIRSASQKVREMITGLSESVRQQVTAVAELAGAVDDVSEMSQGISVATEEQTTNAQQVAKAVESVSRSTQEAASAVEEMSASTEQLTDMALQLMELTSEMRIGSDGAGDNALVGAGAQSSILDFEHIDRAIGAHGAWKLRLREAIHTGKTEWQVETVQRDDACDFGKWLANLPLALRESDEARKVSGYHTRFHKLVAGILEQVKAGKAQAAAGEIEPGSEFATLSSQLMQAMMAWKDSLSGARQHGPKLHTATAGDRNSLEGRPLSRV